MAGILRKIPTKRLEVGGGDWVEFKSRLTQGDREDINRAVTDGSNLKVGKVQIHDEKTGKLVDREVVRGYDVSLNQRLTLAQVITAWGGPGFCTVDHSEDPSDAGHSENAGACKPLPITGETLRDMDTETATLIFNAVDEISPTPDEAGKPTNGSEPTP